MMSVHLCADPDGVGHGAHADFERVSATELRLRGQDALPEAGHGSC